MTNYSYDAAGNLAGYVYPNGVSSTYKYNTLNRLTNMQSICATGAGCGAPQTALAGYAYTLGPTGSRLLVAELSGRTVQYGYDDLYRLTSETVAGAATQNGSISYTYDAVGNRTQRNSTLSALPATGMLNYDANDRTATDTYDANGNLLLGGPGTNVYDFENRLVQAGSIQIVYDGDGNRVQETLAGVTTSYLVADQNLTGYAQVVEELRNGAVNRAYSYGLELINQRQGISGASSTSFYGFDGHGSVRFLTSSTGAVTDTYDYDAFGNLIASTGSTPNSYLFAGEQFDPALGIYYNRARYYDQRRGRFWSMDIFEGRSQDPRSLHKYLFTGEDPVNRIDPSGNEEVNLGATTFAMSLGITLSAISIIGAGYLTYLGLHQEITAAGVEAQNAATQLVAAALNNLQPGVNDGLFQQYFGARTPTAINFVRQDYMRVANGLTQTIKFHKVLFAEAGLFANTYRLTQPVDIGLGPQFFRIPLIGGRDTRAGTIVHEETHAIVGTVDLAYGPSAAQGLSFMDGTDNADTYEYYAEDSYTIAHPGAPTPPH